MFKHLQKSAAMSKVGRFQTPEYDKPTSMSNKRVPGDQFPPLFDGAPVHDVSRRMFNNINLLNCDTVPVVQGFSDGTSYPQAHSHELCTIGEVSSQIDTSDGTRVGTAGNSVCPYPHLLGKSHDSVNVFVKGNNNQEEKPMMQSFPSSKSLCIYQSDASPNQFGMQVRGLESSEEFLAKKLFGKATHGTHNEAPDGTLQQVNAHQSHKTSMELGRRQEQADLRDVIPEKITNSGPSPGFSSLDPMEQKILLDMNENCLEACLGGHSNISTGGFGNTMINAENTNVFPSVQGGSWSLPMHFAAAEASSTDNGPQEEWSGLSFQNPKILTDNQPLDFMECEKSQHNWLDNNLQSTSSLCSKSELLNHSKNISFLGFQQSDQFSLKPKQGMRSVSSHIPNQQSPENNKWLNCNTQKEKTNEVSQPVEGLLHVKSDRHDQNNEHSKSISHQQSINTGRFETGNMTVVAYGKSHNLRKSHDTHVDGSFVNSLGGLEHVKFSQAKTGHVVDNRLICDVKDADVSLKCESIENLGYNQHNESKNPQICINSCEGPSGIYENQECFQREGSTDSYRSNATEHSITGQELQNHAWPHKSGVRHMAGIIQNPSSQIMQRGNSELGNNVSSCIMDLEKGHLPYIQSDLTEEVCARSNTQSNVSVFFDRASAFNVPSMAAQTSQNMLESFHMVDNMKSYQREDLVTFCSVPQLKNPDEYAAQACNDKPSVSQCFGLRLSSPSEWLPLSSCFDSPQISPKMKNSSGTVSFVPSHDSIWLQNQQQLTASVTCQAQEATMLGCGSSQVTSTNLDGQQLPSLKSNHVSLPFAKSDISECSGFSTRLPCRWTTVPSQRNLCVTEQHKVPYSSLPSQDSTCNGPKIASTAPLVLQNEISFGGGNETGTCSMKSECVELEGEQDMKETPGQRISSGTFSPLSQKRKLPSEQESVGKIILEKNAKRLLTPDVLPPRISAQNSAVLRPKKRKISELELLPWHREVTQGTQRLLDISLSDLEWAHAANRFTEKVDEATGNLAPILQPKRRLTLTTRLMQHLFRPAPAVILTGNAISNSYSVAYVAARLALGDACCLSSSFCMPCDIPGVLSESSKTHGGCGAQKIRGVVEDSTNRAIKLEAEFLILDRSASVSDLRVESQELDMFSIINCFAKYHIRGQPRATEAFGTARAIPQKYVTAFPMRRTISDRVQCLPI